MTRIGRIFSQSVWCGPEVKKKKRRPGRRPKVVIERPCERCGNQFATTPKRRNQGEGRFCSKRCRSLANIAISHAGFKSYTPDKNLKAKAQQLVRFAVKLAVLTRPLQCEKCKKFCCKPLAHHEDYGQPLLVWWLCASCHSRVHRGQIKLRMRAVRHA